MKLAWKLILTTVLIVAAAVSFCGTYVVNSSFQGELDVQFDAAVQDSQMFCLAIGGITAQSVRETVADALNRDAYFRPYDFCVYDSHGSLMAASGRHSSHLDLDLARKEQVTSRIFRDEGAYYIETLQLLTVENLDIYVYLFRDITGIFSAQTDNLRASQLAVLVATLSSGAVIVGLSMFLTAPIQKLSRTTRQMAEGQYSRRAKVNTQDELGDLARDFNRMADALEAQISQLEEAAQRQRDFTASFAHELKTPLTSVIGYADTLRSRNLQPAQQMKVANYIFSEGKRLEAMSHALLDLFALEKEAPQLRAIQARQIATEAAESSRYLLRQKKMQLQIDVEEAVIRAEPSLIHTVLYNLIDNARKASPEGAAVELLGRKEGGGYLFCVRDHGRGIPAEALSRLTEAFYMVDKSRSRAEGGAGLGLALCAKIAQIHGGSLKFESIQGQGTTASLRIGGQI